MRGKKIQISDEQSIDEEQVSEDQSDYSDEEQQDYEDNQDIIDGEEDAIEENLNAWGNKKKNFYANQQGSESDDDIEDEEEEEAKRLQTLQAQTLTEENFFDVLLKEKGIEEEEDDDDLLNLDSELLHKRKLSLKEIQSLPEPDKLEFIKNDAPELKYFLDEYEKCVSELKKKIEPSLRYLRSQSNKSGSGINYLETKFSLLMTYCMNITFYLLMKSQCKTVKSHPVIKQLVQIKNMLNKLKPLDEKLSEELKDIAKQAKKQAVLAEDFQDITDNNEMQVEQENVVQSDKKLKNRKEKKQKQNSEQNKEQVQEKQVQVKSTRNQNNLDDSKEQKRLQQGSVVQMVNLKQKKYEEDDILLDDEDLMLGDSEDEQILLTNKKMKKGKKSTLAEILKNREKKQNENENESENEFYDEIQEKKLQKKMKFQQNQENNINQIYLDADDQNNEKLRTINYKILKNKGLIRKRKKIDRNARVKHRKKYDRALVKLKSQGKYIRNKQSAYQGELTGIKANIKRGVSLKA